MFTFPEVLKILSNATYVTSLFPQHLACRGSGRYAEVRAWSLWLTPGTKVDVFSIPWVLPPACCTTEWRPNHSGAGWRWRSPQQAETLSKRWQRPWNQLNHSNITFRPLQSLQTMQGGICKSAYIWYLKTKNVKFCSFVYSLPSLHLSVKKLSLSPLYEKLT